MKLTTNFEGPVNADESIKPATTLITTSIPDSGNLNTTCIASQKKSNPIPLILELALRLGSHPRTANPMYIHPKLKAANRSGSRTNALYRLATRAGNIAIESTLAN
jgi:hypothetical protein